MSTQSKPSRFVRNSDHDRSHNEVERTRLIDEDKNKDEAADLEDQSTQESLSQTSGPSSPYAAPQPRPFRLPVLSICLFILLLSATTICLDNLFVLIQPGPIPSSSSSSSTSPISDPNSIPKSNSTSSPPSDRSQWTALQPPGSRQPIHFEVFDPPPDKASGWTILAIHGLASLNASDAFSMRHALSNINKELFGQSRFVIPFAPIMSIDVRGGQRVPAWFNIHNWEDMRDEEDRQHMQQSVAELHDIVTSLKLDMTRTIFIGFSQGAVMSLLLTLNLAQPPVAVVMLSAFLPVPAELPQLISPSAVGVSSVFWLHGKADPFFKLPGAQLGLKNLRALGFFKSTKLESIPDLGHGFDFRELIIAARWLERFMSKPR